MSKASENVETVRDSWGSNNDGTGSGMDSDKLDGLSAEELQPSVPIQTELDSKPTGSWTFDEALATLHITIPVPTP